MQQCAPDDGQQCNYTPAGKILLHWRTWLMVSSKALLGALTGRHVASPIIRFSHVTARPRARRLLLTLLAKTQHGARGAGAQSKTGGWSFPSFRLELRWSALLWICCRHSICCTLFHCFTPSSKPTSFHKSFPSYFLSFFPDWHDGLWLLTIFWHNPVLFWFHAVD